MSHPAGCYPEGLRFDQIADWRSAEMAFEASGPLAASDDLRQAAALDNGALPLQRRPVAP